MDIIILLTIRYYLPKVTIKDYNAMIDGGNFFNQPIKSWNRMKILEKLLLLKEIITQLIAYLIILVIKKVIKWFQ